jgi:hypothetical protein
MFMEQRALGNLRSKMLFLALMSVGRAFMLLLLMDSIQFYMGIQ